MPARSLRSRFDGTGSLPPRWLHGSARMADRLLPAAAEQMARDAAGRKYSRPPPRQFWTTGAFLIAECGLCGARAVNGIYRESRDLPRSGRGATNGAQARHTRIPFATAGPLLGPPVDEVGTDPGSSAVGQL